MRARITFLAGLAVGYVAGTRAGRERYEQMVKFSRKVTENPAVQKATRTAGSKAAELSKAGQKAAQLSKAAGQKAAEQMPKVAETAKNSASKVRERIPGRNSGDAAITTANGSRPGD